MLTLHYAYSIFHPRHVTVLEESSQFQIHTTFIHQQEPTYGDSWCWK